MRRTSSEDGAAAVEFALVFPILLLLISAIIDFGRLYYEEAALSGSAREGVRLVALGKTGGDTVATAVDDAAGVSGLQVQVYVNGAWIPVQDDMTGAAVSGVIFPECTPGDAVTVVAYAKFTFWTPLPNLFGVFGGQQTIGGKGVMRCGG
jgi:Flp pilus assembly protein TadG